MRCVATRSAVFARLSSSYLPAPLRLPPFCDGHHGGAQVPLRRPGKPPCQSRWHAHPAPCRDIAPNCLLPPLLQARASGDYDNIVGNVAGLGGSSLLMGALGVAPSKDTLWTSSPQPPT